MPGILWTLSHFNLTNPLIFIMSILLFSKFRLRVDKSCAQDCTTRKVGKSGMKPRVGDSRVRVPNSCAEFPAKQIIGSAGSPFSRQPHTPASRGHPGNQ